MQLTPLHKLRPSNAFILYVMQQQKHGSNRTLMLILNFIEHPSHSAKRRQMRGIFIVLRGEALYALVVFILQN